MKKKVNIYCDLDDVIFDFYGGYSERFDTKLLKSWSTSNLFKKRLEILAKDKSYWINLKIKNIPNFRPNGFITARSIVKEWTKESLIRNNIPGRSNLYQIGWNNSKIETLKKVNADIFIDDKYETFKECHKNGIFCLLMDASHNRKYKTKYRIYDLDINNIMNLWEKSKLYQKV